MRETDLYPPIKAFLEAQGFEVKAEVGAADVVACRAGEAPVIVELKTGFSLALVHQVVARLALSDAVYAAVPRGSGKRAWTALREMKTLFRRLGAGLLTVRLEDGLVEVHLEPGPYRPRMAEARKVRLMREFARRAGDPNVGGQGRRGLVTAYRQDAVRCAAVLATSGAAKGAAVAAAAGVARATTIMRDNHYGWFVRVSTGVYDLSEAGRLAIRDAA